MTMSIIGTSNFSSVIIKTLRLIGVLATLIVVGIMYVAIIGISFDISDQRNKLASKFSESLGREVRLEGSLQFEISAHPKLRLGGLHIANAPGFSASEFASLGEARLALDLW